MFDHFGTLCINSLRHLEIPLRCIFCSRDWELVWKRYNNLSLHFLWAYFRWNEWDSHSIWNELLLWQMRCIHFILSECCLWAVTRGILYLSGKVEKNFFDRKSYRLPLWRKNLSWTFMRGIHLTTITINEGCVPIGRKIGFPLIYYYASIWRV